MPVLANDRCVRNISLALLMLCFLFPRLHGQSETGSMCVAPNSAETPQRCAPGLCASGELSFKIDQRPRSAQSFTFRFSELTSLSLCLLLNDLYWTAQLWESKRAPWCKCQ
jgi:hypothetical protein